MLELLLEREIPKKASPTREYSIFQALKFSRAGMEWSVLHLLRAGSSGTKWRGVILPSRTAHSKGPDIQHLAIRRNCRRLESS